MPGRDEICASRHTALCRCRLNRRSLSPMPIVAWRTPEKCGRRVRRALQRCGVIPPHGALLPLLPGCAMCENIGPGGTRASISSTHALVLEPSGSVSAGPGTRKTGAINSAVRVLPLQGRSRGFESLIAHAYRARNPWKFGGQASS